MKKRISVNGKYNFLKNTVSINGGEYFYEFLVDDNFTIKDIYNRVKKELMKNNLIPEYFIDDAVIILNKIIFL